MTPITYALTQALFNFLWQGTLVALLLWGALFLSRRSSPNVRYLLSCGAMIILLIIPALTAGSAYRQSAIPVPAGGTAAEFAPQIVALVAHDSSTQATWATWAAAANEWAVTAWAFGVLLLSMRMAWGAGRVSAMRREAKPAAESIRAMVTNLGERIGVRHVQVLTSSLAEVPSAIGWLRPLILVPLSAITGLTPRQLEAVLAHELAHIRRHDYIVNVLQMAVEALLFYHPAVWWVSRRIRHERELCCDDLAVRSCGDALSYARALAALEKLRVLTPGMAMASTGGPLFYRIQRLVVRETGQSSPSRPAGILALAILGVLSLSFNLSWANGESAAAAPNEAPSAASAAPLEAALLPAPVPTATVPNVVPAPVLQTAAPSPRGDAWVLFRGDVVIANGSPVDEQEARAARRGLTGDMLWFRQDGKTYVTQDPAILERMAKPIEPNQALPNPERQLAAYLRARLEALAHDHQRAEELYKQGLVSQSVVEEQRARRAQANAEAEYARSVEQQARTARNEGTVGELAQLQAQIANLESQLAQLQIAFTRVRAAQAQTNQAQAEVENMRRELERQANKELEETLELLREAVKAGTAKPVQ